MEQFYIAQFHQLDKSLLNSVIGKKYIVDEPFTFRVNLVDISVDEFPKPLIAVCHQCGIFDIFMPIRNYNEATILSFRDYVKRIYEYYISKEDELWWHYDHERDIDDFWGQKDETCCYSISEEKKLRIWSKRILTKIPFPDCKPVNYLLLKEIIQLACLILKCGDGGLMDDILIDVGIAGEEYLANSIKNILGIGTRKMKRQFKAILGFGTDACLTLGRHRYYIQLLYKRFGSFEPVTVSFRTHYDKIRIYFETYYNHRNIDDIVYRIKKIEEAIVSWNSLASKQELQKFIKTYRDVRFSSDPSIECQLLSRKYLDLNHVEDDMLDARYLSMCLLMNEATL